MSTARGILGILVGLLVAVPAASAIDLFGPDDRVAVDPASPPWPAVGLLRFASGGTCSGTLVAPDLVLTAAHCLYTDNGAWDDPETFTSALGTAGIAGASQAPDFNVHLHADTSVIDAEDWALLTLAAPLGTREDALAVRPVGTRELEQAAAGHWLPVAMAGYREGGPLLVQYDCPIAPPGPDGTMGHRCDTLEGDSGGPLLVQDQGRWQVIGVVSASYPGAPAHLAVDSRAFGAAVAERVELATHGNLPLMTRAWILAGGDCTRPDQIWRFLAHDRYVVECPRPGSPGCPRAVNRAALSVDADGVLNIDYPLGAWSLCGLGNSDTLDCFGTSDGRSYRLHRCKTN